MIILNNYKKTQLFFILKQELTNNKKNENQESFLVSSYKQEYLLSILATDWIDQPYNMRINHFIHNNPFYLENLTKTQNLPNNGKIIKSNDQLEYNYNHYYQIILSNKPQNQNKFDKIYKQTLKQFLQCPHNGGICNMEDSYRSHNNTPIPIYTTIPIYYMIQLFSSINSAKQTINNIHPKGKWTSNNVKQLSNKEQILIFNQNDLPQTYHKLENKQYNPLEYNQILFPIIAK